MKIAMWFQIRQGFDTEKQHMLLFQIKRLLIFSMYVYIRTEQWNLVGIESVEKHLRMF